jgi:TetR/AcrR family transcriptional regulator of autoinduction and epiphytic fitness
MSKQQPVKTLTRSEQKRRDILLAAKTAFREFGVDATSMDKIAELAQVSKRTVYNHFKSKEALVMYLLNALWDEALLSSDIEFGKSISIEKQLAKLLDDEIDLIANKDYIELSRVAVGHFLFQPEAIQNEMTGFVQEDTALYKWLESKKLEKKLTHTDTSKAFSQIHSLLKGSCFWPQLIHTKEVLSEKEKKELVEETVKIFLARYQA